MKFRRWNNAVAQALLDRYQREGDDFLGRIFAMDEIWARSYKPTLKRQSNECKHPGLLVQRKCALHNVLRKWRSLWRMWLILHHALSSGQTLYAVYYSMFLQHYLRSAHRRKRRHLVVQNPIIPHDNARSHTAAVMDLLRRWQWEILEHPPYSPDMSPWDCDLFAKVKEPLRGTWYNTRDELICAIGRSTPNINEDERSNSVRRLPNM